MPTSLLTPTVLKPLLVGKDYTILHMGKRLTGKCLKQMHQGYKKKAIISQDRKKNSSCFSWSSSQLLPPLGQLQSWVMNVCQTWVAASSDPFLVLHVGQFDCFLLRGRWRRLIVASNHQLIDHHSSNSPKERSNNWNPPPLLTSPGKHKGNAQV